MASGSTRSEPAPGVEAVLSELGIIVVLLRDSCPSTAEVVVVGGGRYGVADAVDEGVEGDPQLTATSDATTWITGIYIAAIEHCKHKLSYMIFKSVTLWRAAHPRD